MKLLPENPEFEEMQQICDVRRHLNIKTTSRIGPCAAVRVCVCVFTDRLLWKMFDIITAELLIWCARKVSYICQDIAENADHRTNKGTARKPLK